VHWVTYRRAPLTVPKRLPTLPVITVNGKHQELAWAGETVQLKDYGAARQLTLFEHGQVVLQILDPKIRHSPGTPNRRGHEPPPGASVSQMPSRPAPGNGG